MNFMTPVPHVSFPGDLPVRHLTPDFTYVWSASEPHVDRITEGGDLILTLQDLWDIDFLRANAPDQLVPGCSFGEFLDLDVFAKWADGIGLETDGINSMDVLFKLVFAFLLPSIAELEDKRLHELVLEARDGRRDARTLPPYSLRIDIKVVLLFLLDVYDGLFISTEDVERVVAGRVSS